jgi:hypothetical protein
LLMVWPWPDSHIMSPWLKSPAINIPVYVPLLTNSAALSMELLRMRLALRFECGGR